MPTKCAMALYINYMFHKKFKSKFKIKFRFKDAIVVLLI